MFDLLFPKWWSTLKKLIWLKAAALSSAVQKTVTAAIVHIKDALAGPAQNVTIAIEPVQAGAGDPSPENIRPITGWTGANVTRTGANIWGGEKMADDMVAAVNNATYCAKGNDSTGDYVVLEAGNALNNAVFFSGPFKAKTAYTFIIKAQKNMATAGLNIAVTYTDGSYTQMTFPSAPTVGEVYTFVFTTNANKTIRIFSGFFASGTVSFYYDSCGLFEGVLTADQFQPYTGTTIPISFGSAGTVYGGTLDVTTGVLTVSYKGVRVLPSLGWTSNWNATRIRYIVPDMEPRYTGETVSDVKCLCNRFGKDTTAGTYVSFSESTSTPKNAFILFYGVTALDGVSSAETWADYLTNNEVFVTYKLATPQTYQLAAHQIDLLLGENNLWSDTGNTTLIYLADGRASDTEALNILLGGAYRNSGAADEATDKEALEILL